MQGHGGEAVLLQVVGQAVAFHLGAGEHNGLVDGGVAQPVVEHLALVLGVVGPEQHLLDVGVLFLRAVDLHPLHGGAVVVHHAHGQLLDARREGGAEHHGLLALAGQLVDFSQVVREAQVQHAVGLVDHQELHLVQLELHGALQVQQAAGGGHHQVGVLQLGDLQLVGNAAHHVGHAQAAAMAHQVDGVVGHLLGQLAGGAQDQGARHGGLEVAGVGGVLALAALGRRLATRDGLGHFALVLGALLGFGVGLLLDQGVQHGQQEGGGLAAAGLAGDHQVDEAVFLVPGAHGQGNGLALHGGGLGVAQVGHGLHEFRGQAQLDEAVGQDGRRGFCGGLQGVGSKRKVGRGVFALHQKGVGHEFSSHEVRQARQGARAGFADGSKTSTIKRALRGGNQGQRGFEAGPTPSSKPGPPRV